MRSFSKKAMYYGVATSLLVSPFMSGTAFAQEDTTEPTEATTSAPVDNTNISPSTVEPSTQPTIEPDREEPIRPPTVPPKTEPKVTPTTEPKVEPTVEPTIEEEEEEVKYLANLKKDDISVTLRETKIYKDTRFTTVVGTLPKGSPVVVQANQFREHNYVRTASGSGYVYAGDLSEAEKMNPGTGKVTINVAKAKLYSVPDGKTLYREINRNFSYNAIGTYKDYYVIEYGYFMPKSHAAVQSGATGSLRNELTYDKGTLYIHKAVPAYEKMDTKSRQHGIAAVGREYMLTGQKGNWYQVEVNGVKRYFPKSTAHKLTSKITGVADTLIIDKSANVYEKMDYKSKLLGSTFSKSGFQLTGVSDKFWRVNYHGKVGYIPKSQGRVVSHFAPLKPATGWIEIKRNGYYYSMAWTGSRQFNGQNDTAMRVGQAYQVNGHQGNYWRIKVDGKFMFVPKNWTTSTRWIASKGTGHVKFHGVKTRTLPGHTQRIAGTLSAFTNYRITGQRGSWWQIQQGNKRVWVHNQYFKRGVAPKKKPATVRILDSNDQSKWAVEWQANRWKAPARGDGLDNFRYHMARAGCSDVPVMWSTKYPHAAAVYDYKNRQVYVQRGNLRANRTQWTATHECMHHMQNKQFKWNWTAVIKHYGSQFKMECNADYRTHRFLKKNMGSYCRF